MALRKAAALGAAVCLLTSAVVFAAPQAKKPVYKFWPMKRGVRIPYNGAINGSGVIVGDRYYLSTDTGLVYALDLKQGKALWQAKTKTALSYPPCAVGGLVLAVDDEGVVYAWDEKGKAAWTVATKEPPAAGPFVLGERILIYRKAGHFSLFDWRARKPAGSLTVAGESIDSWLVADGRLYAVLRGGAIVTLDPEGKETDRLTSDIPYRGPLAVSKETILAGKEGGILESFDRVKRKVRWQRKLGLALKAIIPMGEKRVCVLSTNDVLYALSARNGDLLWWRSDHPLEIPLPGFWQRRIMAMFGTSEIFGLDERTGESRWRHDVGVKIVGGPQAWGENVIVQLFTESIRRGYVQILGPDVPAKSP